MRRGLVLVIFAALLSLTACEPPPAPGAYVPPSIVATLITPSTPLTYTFVMIHSGYDWWVQIGAKSDADGIHVAVQAWHTLVSNYFMEWDTLTPGSSHTFGIDWSPGGWRLWFDGRVMTVQNPGQCPPCATRQNAETTTA